MFFSSISRNNDSPASIISFVKICSTIFFLSKLRCHISLKHRHYINLQLVFWLYLYHISLIPTNPLQ